MIEIGSKWQHKDGGVYDVINILDINVSTNVSHPSNYKRTVWYKNQQDETYVRTEKHFLESFKPVEPEFTYPMWFRLRTNGKVVKFTGLREGEIVGCGAKRVDWLPHTDIFTWEKISEPKSKKTIVLETWLMKDQDDCLYTIDVEARWIDNYDMHSYRVKLLSTREVEIDE